MPLRENNLLELIRKHSGKSVKQLAQLAGYTTTTKTGQKRVKVLAFQNALLAAKKITFKASAGDMEHVQRGRKANYHIQVQQNGNLLIGAAYTRQMGLLPGMQFEIQPGRRTIKLVQVESSPQSDDIEVAKLNNDELLELTKSTFTDREDYRLHELLDKKHTDSLHGDEYAELQNLLVEYDKGMLRKSEALAERRKRGLSQVAIV